MLAIVAISLTLAVPSFSSVVANQSVRTVAWDLYASIVLARSEAIKRNQTVTLAAKNGGWAAGWTVSTPAAEIAVYGPARGVEVGNGPDAIQFGRSGRVIGNTSPSFVISATAVESVDERCLGLDLSGRPYLEKKPLCSS